MMGKKKKKNKSKKHEQSEVVELETHSTRNSPSPAAIEKTTIHTSGVVPHVVNFIRHALDKTKKSKRKKPGGDGPNTSEHASDQAPASKKVKKDKMTDEAGALEVGATGIQDKKTSESEATITRLLNLANYEDDGLNSSVGDYYGLMGNSPDKNRDCSDSANAQVEVGESLLVKSSPEYLSIYNLSEDEMVVLMEYPGELSFVGKVQLKVLKGAVTVLGFEMNAGSDKFHSIYSPTSTNHLTITTLQSDEESDFQPLFPEMSEELTHSTVVLCFKKLEDDVCKFVSVSYPKLFEKYNFQRRVFSEVKGEKTNDIDVLKSLNVHVCDHDNQQKLFLSKEYQLVATEWTKAVCTSDVAPIIVLCGGRNVGKSTFARFLVNKTLNVTEAVSYLECDIGQSEFTPSCCVSLNHITEPLLGPPFTHQSTPACMSFHGSSNAAINPTRYINCVEYVYRKYLLSEKKNPLIVNTMGWNLGIGINILVNILKLIGPTFVLQFDSRSQVKNFPDMTLNYVKNMRGWRDIADDMIEPDESLKYSFIIIDAVELPPEDQIHRYGAPDHRHMSTLAMLSHMLPTEQSMLNDVVPYRVSWNQVALHVCSEVVPNSQILYVMNGAIVALCHVDDSKMLKSSKDKTLPMFLADTPICEPVGFGIIRRIDPLEKAFYIITSTPYDVLKTVNCLLKGTLDIPPKITLNQTCRGNIPYMGSYNHNISGSSSVRGRTFRLRKHFV